MLKSITLENFFSFGAPTKIDLNPGLNVLIGINGSGKTNLLKAIQLLYEGLSSNGRGLQKLFLQDWGGFDNVYNKAGGSGAECIRLRYEFDAYEFDKAINSRFDEDSGAVLDRVDNDVYIYIIEMYKKNQHDYFICEKYANKAKLETYGHFFIEIEDGEGVMWGKDKYAREIFTNGKELFLKTIPDSWAVDSFFPYIYFHTAPRSPLRQAAPFSTEKALLPNGENLPHVLNHIQHNHNRYFEKLENALTEINPNFKGISFMPVSSSLLLALREKGLNKTIPIEHISDGTLRYLLLLAIFCNPDGGRLISLDEPEAGLHPDMIAGIAKLMKDCAREFGTQIFLATHSPLLLNAFEIEDTLIFEKDEQNNTRVLAKTSEDFAEWADGYTLGQLWMMGKIGGTRY